MVRKALMVLALILIPWLVSADEQTTDSVSFTLRGVVTARAEVAVESRSDGVDIAASVNFAAGCTVTVTGTDDLPAGATHSVSDEDATAIRYVSSAPDAGSTIRITVQAN